MSIGDITAFRGRNAIDANGDKLGTIYEDTETGKPEWLAVKTGLFGSKVSFIPLAEAGESGDDIRVPYTKAQVKDAPNADADSGLSPDEERRLYSHYDLPYSENRSDSGLPDGGTGTTGTTGGTRGPRATPARRRAPRRATRRRPALPASSATTSPAPRPIRR